MKTGSRAPLAVGGRLGRYEVVRTLGAGAHGRVYEARMLGPDGPIRQVALKVQHQGDGIVREARLGGLLRHPNLVDVLEVGEVDGVWFSAMELCDGGTLDGLGALPPAAVVDVGLQVCDALQYAHESLGLVHLDLKPQNLLLQGATVKVADLSIARARGYASDPRALGTRGYMAPEQASGATPDARADIYALCVVLHELAAGVGAAGASATYAVGEPDPRATAMFEDPPAFVAVGAIEAPWLEPVLARGLDPDPAARFESMAELAAALRALQAQGPDLAAFLGTSVVAPAPSIRDLGPMVGRDGELRTLRDALGAPGLVTLKGPGGIGKSRLARELAQADSGHAWCDLSEARSEAEVLDAVAQALGVPLRRAPSTEAAAARLGHALAGRGEALLVLDTFEHLLGFAGLVARWVEAAPSARVLATSRAPLRVPGERVVEVGPLSSSGARELLVEVAGRRGRAVAHDPAVDAIVERLDGLPLALELAGGRIGVWSPEEVLGQLDLGSMRSAEAGRSTRQATLRGALAWSWALLDDVEQRVLARLSVFRGGFTLAAAQGIVGAVEGRPVVQVLEALADRSLLSWRDGRFELLSPVRAWAAEFVDDAVALEEAHAAWFIAQVQARAGGPGALRAESRNLVVAAETASRSGALGGVATLVRALTSLAGAGIGSWSRVVGLAEAALARGEAGGGARALLLVSWGWARFMQGGYAAALEAYERALPLATAEGDQAISLDVQLGLGLVLLEMGEVDRAEAHLRSAHELARRTGTANGEGTALGNLGIIASDTGRPDEAIACYEQAVELLRRAGDRNAAATYLSNLANVHGNCGRRELGERLQEAALAEAVALGDRLLEGVIRTAQGVTAHQAGRSAEARLEFEAAGQIQRELGLRGAEGGTFGNLGLVAAADGRMEDAERFYEAALERFREVGDRRAVGRFLNNLAGVLVTRDPARAEATYREALVLHRASRARRSEGIALVGLASLRAAAGDLAAAIVECEAGVRILEEVQYPAGVGVGLGELASLQAAAGRLDEAAASAARGAEILREIGALADLAEVELVRAEVARLSGDVAAAERCVAEVEALADELGLAPDHPTRQKVRDARLARSERL